MAEPNFTNKDRTTNRRRNNLDVTLGVGKLPPQALDLEEAVLGALMLEKDALTSVVDILTAESFYKDSHKVIYQAILDLFNASEPIRSEEHTSELQSRP